MARNDKPPEDKGKVKFRFVEFEMEGGSSNLEETIKSIAHAITRGSQVPTRIIAPPKSPAAGALPAPPANGNGAGSTELEIEPEVVEDETEIENSDNGRNPARQPKERKFRQPRFMDELDMDTEPSFRSFAEEYAPTSDAAKYIVIAAWFKLHRNTPEIGADHAFTCYRKMRWPERDDASQPFRDLKRKQFVESPKNGIWKITQLGIDELERIKNKAGV